jgi:hypothetical protein
MYVIDVMRGCRRREVVERMEMKERRKRIV